MEGLMQEIDMKNLILVKFQALSAVRGIKNVTVDMLAKECGISKKTFYKYYQSKDEIVENFADNVVNNIAEEFVLIRKSKSNPEEMINAFFDIIFAIIKNIPSAMIQDIRRFYPDVEARINTLREKYSVVFVATIKEGIKSGVFKDINPLFLEGFYLGAVNEVFKPEFILKNNITINEAVSSFKTILLTGLLRR